MSRRFWNFYLIVLSLLALLLGAQLGHAQQTARIVHYHANDIVAIRARMHYTTLIALPTNEKILEIATGDKDFWILDAVQNYCFLHPAKEGIHSNLNLITDKGNVYSFTLDDDEAADPDLKVVIEPSDPSTLASVHGPEKFVPASEVTVARIQAQAAELHAQQSVEQFRANYPVEHLAFDYKYKSKPPFDIQAIYHDDHFTYIKSSAPEKFAVYELKDGKPDLVSFQLKGSTYVIAQVVDNGYLQIGKKKLTFARKGK
jgi:type IV secretion system protein VirB9